MMYGFWDIKCKGQFFCHFGPFLPFDTPNNPKNQNFEKIKKSLDILSIYTAVPQMMIIWGMVPEISSLADRIFCHFGLLFTLLPPNNPEKIFLKKWKKLLEVYIIILNMSTVNENHTIQSETQCAPDRLFLSSWAIFCPFTPITAWKMKISK